MNILGYEVAENKKTLIIVEAGINHNGDFGKAIEMINVAKQCGADVVKFQMRNLETLYRDKCLNNPSEESHSLGVYIPILKDCEFTVDQHKKLMEECKKLDIKYLCSPWDIESVNVLEQLGVGAYKVPSACLSDVYLVDRLYETGKPVIFSTGMHTEKEMNLLVNKYLKQFGSEKMAVLHCVSSYPTANRDVNLKFLQYLINRLPCVTGYSGHERGIPITVAAVAMGAKIIERHFTLDRTLPGPDHAASLEPHGLETLIRHIRAVDEAMGSAKRVNQGEIVARETLGKILTWAKDAQAGDIVSRGHFCATSPGYGISAYRADEFIGKIVRKSINKGKPVNENDLKIEKGEEK